MTVPKSSAVSLTPKIANLSFFLNRVEEHVNLTAQGIELCDDSNTFTVYEYAVAIVMLSIIIFGIVANTMNLLVFCHKTMRRSSLINWYLACLSASDTVALSCSIINLALPRIAEYNRQLHVATAAAQMMYLTYPLGLMAQTCSVWLTVSVSGHRCVSVWFPFQAYRFCNRKIVKLVITLDMLFALTYNLPKFFELRIKFCYSTLYEGVLATAVAGSIRTDIYIKYYLGWMYLFVMLVLPFILLIGMNSLVVISVHKSRKRHEEIALTGCHELKDETRKERKTTFMLVGVVVVFLICNVPALIASFLEMLVLGKDSNSFLTSLYSSMVYTGNTLVLINMSINILIFVAFSDKYRTLLLYYLTSVCDHRKAYERMMTKLEHTAV